MGKKKKILTKKVYSRITPENYKRLETIASKYGFKSVYEIVQSLIHCWECNLNSVWFLFLLNHNKYNFFFLDLQMLLKVVFGCVQGRRR
ncbi:hypothetical protein ACMSD4_00005, partial [Bacteroides thetaiotaomicron]